MKNIIYLCFLLLCIGCATNTDNDTSKEITKTFPKYGFSITAPCVLEDATSKARKHIDGDLEVEYSGVENFGDTVNATAYQVLVHKISENSFENEDQLNEFMDQVKKSGFTNVEKVLFSDNKYIGYVGDIFKNGSMNRMVQFRKGKYLISLIVITNTGLDEKFKNFTESFKAID